MWHTPRPLAPDWPQGRLPQAPQGSDLVSAMYASEPSGPARPPLDPPRVRQPGESGEMRAVFTRTSSTPQPPRLRDFPPAPGNFADTKNNNSSLNKPHSDRTPVSGRVHNECTKRCIPFLVQVNSGLSTPSENLSRTCKVQGQGFNEQSRTHPISSHPFIAASPQRELTVCEVWYATRHMVQGLIARRFQCERSSGQVVQYICVCSVCGPYADAFRKVLLWSRVRRGNRAGTWKWQQQQGKNINKYRITVA